MGQAGRLHDSDVDIKDQLLVFRDLEPDPLQSDEHNLLQLVAKAPNLKEPPGSAIPKIQERNR